MEPIFDPDYWKKRLEHARAGHLHHAVFRCPLDRWQAIEEKHRQILAKHIQFDTTILDVGCGYGRLIDLLPEHWIAGGYTGIDISPALIDLAREKYDNKYSFLCCDIRQIDTRPLLRLIKYDIAILISIRPMIIRNAGQEQWDAIEKSIRQRAEKILYLEYDPENEGSLE